MPPQLPSSYSHVCALFGTFSPWLFRVECKIEGLKTRVQTAAIFFRTGGRTLGGETVIITARRGQSDVTTTIGASRLRVETLHSNIVSPFIHGFLSLWIAQSFFWRLYFGLYLSYSLTVTLNFAITPNARSCRLTINKGLLSLDAHHGHKR